MSKIEVQELKIKVTDLMNCIESLQEQIKNSTPAKNSSDVIFCPSLNSTLY